jgi:plastocyanin
MRISPRNAIALLIAGIAAALLVACGGGNSSNSGGTPASGGAASATATGTPVTATETEFSIVLSPATLSPGTYTFTIKNNGTMPHNLNIKGPGVDSQVSPTVDPGGTGQLTVTLQKGSYELWCSVDSHKEQGMDMTIQVG